MKKNKLTSIIAMASSIALVGSMVSVPAYATESETALVSQFNAEEGDAQEAIVLSSETDTQKSEATDQTVAASTSAATPETTADNHSHNENGEEAGHGHSEEATDFVDDPINLQPVNIQTGQDTQSQSRMARAAVSTFAAPTTAINVIDLSQWVVFDHYDYNNGSAQPADWDSSVNSDGLHPWFYFNETYANTGHSGEYYDLSGAGTTPTKTEYINNVLNNKNYSGTPSVARVNQHIFTMGTETNAEMIFTGYGTPGYLDFALTKTPTTDDSLKSIAFDIDAAAIYPHTTASFGFFVNSGVSGDTFKGQAVNFQVSGTTLTPQIVDLSSGVSATNLHNGTFPTGTNYGSSINLNQGIGQYHLDIQVDNASNLLSVEITPYSAVNVLDTEAKQTFTAPLANTGYQAFGPYVRYNSHGCPELSWMKFGNMQLSSNLDVYFWSNPNNGDKGENFAVVQGIEKGQTITSTDGSTMPTAPSQSGKAFIGWNTKADGTGDWFTADTPLSNTTNVYAIWGESGISVNYGKGPEWIDGLVDVNIIITSAYPPTSVEVEMPDGTKVPVEVEQNPANPSEYVGKVSIDRNTIDAIVTAVVPDGQGGENQLTTDIDVTWIDKAAPIISNLPQGDGNHIISYEDMQNIVFQDPDEVNGEINGQHASGINNDSRKVYFFQNGEIVAESTWDNLEQTMKDLPAGIYDYAVSVEDNVGHFNDSNGTSTEPSAGPKPSEPTVSGVIINPGPPVIQPNLSFADGSGSYTDGSWTNKDVVVEYNVNGGGLDLSQVTENGSNVLTTVGGVFDQNFTVTENGTHTYVVDATNIANSTAEEKTITVRIDKEAPVVTLPKLDDNNIIDVINGATFDDEASGVEADSEYVKVIDKDGNVILEGTDEYVIGCIERNELPSGEYEIEVTVKDNAGNVSEPKSEKVYRLNDGDEAITIDVEYSTTDWTNGDVTATYTVSSPLGVDKVIVDGVEVTLDSNGKGTVSVPANTSTKPIEVEASTSLGHSTEAAIQVNNIDKTAPVPTLPEANTTFNESNVSLEDLLGLERNAVVSGVNDRETQFVAVPYVNGKLSPADAITITDINSPNWAEGKLQEGVVYQLTLSGADNAGNASTKTVDQVQYIKDPAAAKANKEVDVWVKNIDGSLFQVNVESQTYPISKITMSIDGGAEKVITTSPGVTSTSFTANFLANQKVVIKTTLLSGSTVTTTFTPFSDAVTEGSNYVSANRPQVVQPEGLIIASSTLTSNANTIGTSNFQNAVTEGFEFGGSAANGATITKYWAQRNQVGAYTAYTPTTISTVYRLTPSIAYNIIIEVSYDGQTYYFDGTSTTGKTTKPTTGGYVVKGA